MSDPHDWGTGEAPKPNRSIRDDPRPKWHVEPRTFRDLLNRAGPYANGVKAHLEWGAIETWMMKGAANAALSSAFIPIEAGSLSVSLTRQAHEHEAGWPQLSDRRVIPALYDLPADAQSIARRMAGEIRVLWEEARRPYIDTRRYKDAYRFLVACVRSGSIPDLLTIGEVPPLPASKPHPILIPKETP